MLIVDVVFEAIIPIKGHSATGMCADERSFTSVNQTMSLQVGFTGETTATASKRTFERFNLLTRTSLTRSGMMFNDGIWC